MPSSYYLDDFTIKNKNAFIKTFTIGFFIIFSLILYNIS